MGESDVPETIELPQSYTLFTPSNASSPKICRDFVRSALATLGLGDLAETAALCTSELVTNVHQHAKGDVHLRTRIESTHIRIAVYDDCPGLPAPRRAKSADEDGRGLFLVTALSDVCGVSRATHGKGVWFQLNRE
ncbi:ATP-binding protein [Streptomyces sp. NPDC048442]|uniref:ATP-binding protein n=1 Tax=Streptomyces sp. NPDC048442 TaxID=3154823 RepID=UPI003413A285